MEQPINRPEKGQKKYYSGKKKRHTITWQIVTSDGRKITSTSKSHYGKTHDKKCTIKPGWCATCLEIRATPIVYM